MRGGRDSTVFQDKAVVHEYIQALKLGAKEKALAIYKANPDLQERMKLRYEEWYSTKEGGDQ